MIPIVSKDNIESSEQVSECEIKDEIEEIEKAHIALNLTEETPESSKHVSSKDQDTTEISSEGEIKDETMDITKEDEANEPTEKSFEGERKQETSETNDIEKDVDEKLSEGKTT